ncbi:hypothetical protein [Pseudonocardia kunmingensis]|uniref:hypothetical protein n=1 Tax=Pseudonocardia kunmingensis TaxID=630975 RepID=UPI00115270C7|nr:hypothetical protein [Pseudonocardia kunmingensis]
MTADPVMAVVRVKAPAEVDPYVLEAELTRAICTRSMTAEVVLLPSWRRGSRRGMRRYGFVAALSAPAARSASELTGTAEKVLRKALRTRFGSAASAKVRLARSAHEVDVLWCSVRGTPRRP